MPVIPIIPRYTDYIRCQKNFNSVYARVMKDKRITAFLDQCLLDPRCNGMNLSVRRCISFSSAELPDHADSAHSPLSTAPARDS